MMLRVIVFVISSLEVILARVIYVPERTPLINRDVLPSSGPKNVPNGIDFSQEHLNNIGTTDMYVHRPVIDKRSDHQIVLSRHGLIFDWPPTMPFFERKYILENYLRYLTNSGILTHLNNVQDFVLVPREYIANIAGRSEGLVDNTLVQGWKRQTSKTNNYGINFVPLSTHQGVLNSGSVTNTNLNQNVLTNSQNTRNYIEPTPTEMKLNIVETNIPFVHPVMPSINDNTFVDLGHRNNDVQLVVADQYVTEEKTSIASAPVVERPIAVTGPILEPVKPLKQLIPENVMNVASKTSAIDNTKPVLAETTGNKISQKRVIIRPVLENQETKSGDNIKVGGIENIASIQPKANLLKDQLPLMEGGSVAPTVSKPQLSIPLSEALQEPSAVQMIKKDGNNINIHHEQHTADMNMHHSQQLNGQSFIELRGHSLPNHVETTEVNKADLPPLREIFGGDALFKPKIKLVQLFPMSDKQAALLQFQG